MRTVYGTSLAKLVKQNCHSGNVADGCKASAMQWGRGCDHEDDAKRLFLKATAKEHENLDIMTAGLHLSPEYP